MVKLLKSSEQKGTLLVEAIAMLALIAMVTPTLYRKSAERLQEIQDINIASQMRTLNSAIESYVKTSAADIALYLQQDSSATSVEICYEDDTPGCLKTGYSSIIPFGFNPEDVKNFLSPRVFLHGYNGVLTYYIVYEKETEIGAKRATRLASLVGANGGVVQYGGINSTGNDLTIQGTGNAWSLDQEKIDEIDLDSSMLTKDSLVVTSKEPIVIDQTENDVYLYRIPPTTDNLSDFYKNTMITDLYMGGYDVEVAGFNMAPKDYYSIFNVRKLTLNTLCKNEQLIGAAHVDDALGCVPQDVADLYIGKPKGAFLDQPGANLHADGKTRYYNPNEGAAWIYGNLSALNESFKVFRGGLTGTEDASTVVSRTTGYDVMQFARLVNQENNKSFEVYDDSTSVDLQIFNARNEEGSARVSMMNGLVNVVETLNNPDINAFTGKALAVGQDSSTGGEGSLLTAYHENDENFVYVNSGNVSSTTWINKYGGDVYINKLAATEGSSFIPSNTYINDAGGTLLAGKEGEWLRAVNEEGSAQVHLLNSGSSNAGERIFTVGNSDVENVANMMYGDSTRVSLRGDSFRVYNTEVDLSSGVGGVDFVEGVLGGPSIGNGTTNLYDGATVVATQTMDVLGSTYLGARDMSTEVDDGAVYTRDRWHVGVAGSAWVDDTLWARRGWLKKGGMSELHAGFSSFSEFDADPEGAWLNVYNDPSRGMIIRNKDAITGAGSSDTDILFKASSSGVQIWGNATGAAVGSTGTYAEWGADAVMVGAGARTGFAVPTNAFHADINAANLQGSSLVNIYTVAESGVDGVVNVQDGAMQFRGRPGSSAVYENEILTQARWFGVTANSSYVDEDSVQFKVGSSAAFATESEVRVKNADFVVRDSSNVGKFWVRPDEGDNSSFAQVNVDGSFHVTGNEVIHIASNAENSAENDSQRAMFEIDPNYIQVWGKTLNGDYAGSSASDYYAMLKINPYDTSGEETLADDVDNASIYVRKGAIELMPSELVGSSQVGASEGFGYIKANRLVSNSGKKINIDVTNVPGHRDSGYDEYMVNPAYTSVMHDIKLTTRGGGRLSDILPDYVLKGVYNVSNDFVEGSKRRRIGWSCGTQCTDGTYEKENSNVKWANSYVGKIPYAMCPPGYANLATIMPISFMMGQAGDIMKVGSGVGHDWGARGSTEGQYYVNLSPVQAAVLANAEASGDKKEIGYPGYHRVRSVSLEKLNSDAEFSEGSVDPEDLKSITSSQIEGWFMGMPYEGEIRESLSDYEAYMQYNSPDSSITNVGTWRYEDATTGKIYSLVQPLYFQQNTWLKTSVTPNGDHWEAYMGFIYDKATWVNIGTGLGNEGLVSNNSNTGSSEAFKGYGVANNFVWNLFPVPTNSIEGHATVYCYFDRTQFQNYRDNEGNPLVDPIDQMSSYRVPGATDKGASGSSDAVRDYINRLDDPTLKYVDPW